MCLYHWEQPLFSLNAVDPLNFYLGTCSSFHITFTERHNLMYRLCTHILAGSWHSHRGFTGLFTVLDIHWMWLQYLPDQTSQNFLRPEVQQGSVFAEVTDKLQFISRRDRFQLNTYRNAITCPSGEIDVIWICRNPSISSFNIWSNIFTDAIYPLTGSVGSCEKYRTWRELSAMYIRFSVC